MITAAAGSVVIHCETDRARGDWHTGIFTNSGSISVLVKILAGSTGLWSDQLTGCAAVRVSRKTRFCSCWIAGCQLDRTGQPSIATSFGFIEIQRQ